MTDTFSAPLWACLLIGGKSSRMGQPKHLLPLAGGRVWLQRAAALLRSRVTGLVLAGAGEIPASLAALPHLKDAAGGQGPLTGIVAAFRHQPEASWLVLACDMPRVTAAAIDWLLAARRPGDWAIMPRLAANARPEPLFAWYGPECRPLFQERLARGKMCLHELAAHPSIRSPLVPAALCDNWSNINTPEELAALNHELAEAGEEP
ncbi:MAG: molybdenum cofactor guanylyltransferase [Desulfobulbaceae bacterium]|jgi:molybdopterin-guanine dinucleotide biosynthesis protein A|nr:molybdenum cofactor guanylyltransferase [Desulfobulbaceae bacterium]